MATSVFRKIADGLTATAFPNAVYTVNADTKAAINEFSFYNPGVSAISVSAKFYAGGSTEVWVVKDVTLAAKQTYHGKGYFGLYEADAIHAITDSGSVDVVVGGVEHDANDSRINRAYIQTIDSSWQTLVTAGSGNATVNDLQVINHSGSNRTFDIRVVSSTEGTYEVLNTYSLTPGEHYGHFGSIPLLSGDQLQIQASATGSLDCIASYIV